MRVRVGQQQNTYANVLWDSCASICLITNTKAKRLDLKGLPCNISLVMIGGNMEKIKSYLYIVPLIDLTGSFSWIEAYSIETIPSTMQNGYSSKLKKYFPEISAAFDEATNQVVNILIGYSYAAWHPVPVKCYDHLLIMSNRFGKCVAGNLSEFMENQTNMKRTRVSLPGKRLRYFTKEFG